MISDEGFPILRSETRIARRMVHLPVSSYGSRRDLDANFEPQLVSNAFFTPGRIIADNCRIS